MIETTRETCRICGEEYDDSHIVPRAPFAPYWCEKCTEEVNEASGGSWVSAVYHASKRNPYED